MKNLGYIDYDVSLPDNVPFNIIEQLNKLEQYNTEGDDVCYYDRWDDIIILAKNAMVAGVLSKKIGNFQKKDTGTRQKWLVIWRNWGLLRNKSGDVLSPIYDNGASFSPNVPEKRIISKLNNLEALEKGIYDSVTAYSLDGESNAKFVDILKLESDDLKKAIKRVVPLIKNKMADINNMINSIPDTAGDFSIISKERKQLYQKEMEFRLEKLLLPEYSKIISDEDLNQDLLLE